MMGEKGDANNQQRKGNRQLLILESNIGNKLTLGGVRHILLSCHNIANIY